MKKGSFTTVSCSSLGHYVTRSACSVVTLIWERALHTMTSNSKTFLAAILGSDCCAKPLAVPRWPTGRLACVKGLEISEAVADIVLFPLMCPRAGNILCQPVVHALAAANLSVQTTHHYPSLNACRYRGYS